MAYDEDLAERLRRVIGPAPDVAERKMFGGIAFLRGGKMFIGIVKDDLMVRVGPEGYPDALARPQVRPMDFNGKPALGYVYVAPAGSRTDTELADWVGRALAFVDTLASGSGRQGSSTSRAASGRK